MEQEKINKMRELKLYLESKGENVQNIKYIGTINHNQKVNETQNIEDTQEETIENIENDKKRLGIDIYLCEMKIIDENQKEIRIIKYYTDDFECIAVENEINGIIPTEEYSDDKKIIEQLETLDKEGLIDLEEENEKEIAGIAETLGVEKEKIENIAEIQLEKKDPKEKDLGNVKDINAKNLASINANEKITTRDSMATLLGVEGKGYTKIAVVNTSEVEGTQNTTSFSFVGIKANGQMEKIDSLKQIEGKKPDRIINTISADGKEITEETAYSMYRVKGREDEQLSVNIDELNTIRVSFVRTAPESDESLSIPIETNTIAKTSYKDKDFMNSITNPKVTTEMERIEENKNEQPKVNLETIEDNSEHTEEYIPNTDIRWEDFATQCGFRGEGSIQRAKEVFEKAKGDDSSISNKELAEQIVSDMEEQYKGEQNLQNN